jgi:uncharacterized protein YeaO (DUF488 family)
MSILIVQLGSSRKKGEGIRMGTVRYPPRGISKKLHSQLNYYDLWLPELAPSKALLDWYKRRDASKEHWATFRARFEKELGKPPADRIMNILARLSHQANFSIGCYCENEDACHRSVLRMVLLKRGADLDNI